MQENNNKELAPNQDLELNANDLEGGAAVAVTFVSRTFLFAVHKTLVY